MIFRECRMELWTGHRVLHQCPLFHSREPIEALQSVKESLLYEIEDVDYSVRPELENNENFFFYCNDRAQ